MRRMVDKKRGALASRIAAGKAEPISERERDQLQELKDTYARRFGPEKAERLSKSLRTT